MTDENEVVDEIIAARSGLNNRHRSDLLEQAADGLLPYPAETASV